MSRASATSSANCTENIKGTTPCVKTVAVLNSWGNSARGAANGSPCAVPEAELQLCGVIEALSGAPFDVKFISFDDIKADPKVLDGMDVLINVGDGDTAHTGGKVWEDPIFPLPSRALSTAAAV